MNYITNGSGNIAVYPIEGLSPYQNKFFSYGMELTIGGLSEFA